MVSILEPGCELHATRAAANCRESLSAAQLHGKR
jgi:hypothetical protein